VAASAQLAMSDVTGRDMWHKVLQEVGGDHSKVSDLVRLMEARNAGTRAAAPGSEGSTK
jgi:hypothetical protein